MILSRVLTLVLSIVVTVVTAGCLFSPDIVMRDKDGHEAVCEHVRGIGGVRTHLLISEQRHCVEDYQRQGYERVPSVAEGKR
jgi:hypothetical protein